MTACGHVHRTVDIAFPRDQMKIDDVYRYTSCRHTKSPNHTFRTSWTCKEGLNPPHAMDHRGSAAWQCFGSDGSAAPLTVLRNIWAAVLGGLCAARVLARYGVDTTVLEGRNRIGGPALHSFPHMHCSHCTVVPVPLYPHILAAPSSLRGPFPRSLTVDIHSPHPSSWPSNRSLSILL